MANKMVEMTFAIGAALAGNFSGTFGKAGQALSQLQKQTSSLQKVSGQIGAYQKMQASMQQGAEKLNAARIRVKELGQQMKAAGTPTADLKRKFTAAHQEAHRLETALNSQRKKLGELRSELKGAGVDTNNLTSEQERLAKQSKRLADAQTKLQNSRAALQQTREKLSWNNVKGDLIKAAGIGLSLGAPVMQAAEFEHAAARLNAVAFSGGGRNAEEDAKSFKELQAQARQLGRDTQFTAVQAAQSQENLARAGFKANEIIAAMPGLLDMAAAEGMDLATAADIMASSLRGFGLDAKDAGRVSNILAQTSAASNSSITGLGDSLKYVAPVASGLGISIEEVNAMLGTMANAGIKGSQGGTALRAALQRLSKEPKAVEKALGQLGISARDAKGNMREIPELMQALSNKMKNMGSADKMKYLSNIFGSEAASGMLAVMEAAVNGSLQELTRLNRESSGQLQALSKHTGLSLDELRAGMQETDKYARALGISFSDLSVYTTMLIKGGIQASEADKAMSSAFGRIKDNTKAVTKALKAYNIALTDDKGNMRDFNMILTDLYNNMKDMSQDERLKALDEIFGVGNGKAIQVLMKGLQNNAYDEYSKVAESATGVSKEMAEKVLKTFWGQKQLLMSGISDIMISIGEVILPVTKEILDSFKKWTASFGELIAKHPQWTKWIVGTVSAIAALKVGVTALKYAWLGIKLPFQMAKVTFDIFTLKALRNAKTLKEAGKSAGLFSKITGKLSAGVKNIGKAFSSIGKGIVKAFFGLMSMGKSLITGLFSPLGIKILLITGLIAALAAGAYLIYKNWDEIKEWWNSWTLKDVWAVVKGYASNAWAYVKEILWDSWTIGDIFAPLLTACSKAIDYLKGKWTDFKAWIKGVFSPDTFDYMTTPEFIAEAKVVGSPEYHINAMNSAFALPEISVTQEIAVQQKAAVKNNVSDEVKKVASEAAYIEQQLQKQTQNVTILNTMSEGFSERVTEMNKAWEPFKKSLGEGFEQIFSVIQSIAEKIRGVVIPAVNELASALSKIANEILSIVQAGALEVEVKVPSSDTMKSYSRTAGGRNKNGWYPHAMGGIFSQPHLGLIAEAGREAVIPLENKVRGIPLWKAAGEEMGLLFGSTTNNYNRTNSMNFSPVYNITVNGSEPSVAENFRRIIEETFADMMNEAERTAFR